MKIEEHKQIEKLWTDYEQGIKLYILKMTKDEEIAKDLTHDVLLKLYKSCCSDREIKNVKSWLYQIARNTYFDYFKKNRKCTNDVPELFGEEDNSNFYEEGSILVKPLLNALPEKYSIPLTMSDLYGIKQSEIADELNLSLSATKSRIQRGRKMVKELLKECVIIKTDNKGTPSSMYLKTDCKDIKNYEKI